MSDNVLDFAKPRYRGDEPVVKPALRVLGMASMVTLNDNGAVHEGVLSIEHPERMVVISLSAAPTPSEVARLWLLVEGFRSYRC